MEAGEEFAPRLLWLCTADNSGQGLIHRAVNDPANRNPLRERICWNDVAKGSDVVQRLQMRLNLDWDCHPCNSVIALMEVRPAQAYDDLLYMRSGERTQCEFYRSLAWTSTREMHFLLCWQSTHCRRQWSSLSFARHR